MTNKKATKRALILSIISMLICVVMLAGTTFAWFTDSVTSGKNTIVAGNLDVELEYSKDYSTWNTVEGATDIFDPNALWEPGRTEVVYLKISNLGTLALKYNFAINFEDTVVGTSVLGNEIYLSEYLEYGIADVTAKFADRDAARAAVKDSAVPLADYSVDGNMKAGDAAKTVALVVYMPETVENEANYRGNAIPKIELGIKLEATQDTVEKDSFDEKYDMMADPVEITSVDDLKNAFKNGGGFVLTDDITLTDTLMAYKDVVIDLNGKTITAPATGNMFQSQSNAAPSMTISSSKSGAAINVSGGDTSVLLGYGSTVIENVTINVTGCDNYSPNPFSVYGDLTLGKGTVVNVDYLGTALIDNNGAVDVVIDGAEINIGTFKTNGTTLITLNQASTLVMKDTTMKIDNFVLSQFGGEGLVDKIDGVTVDSCTFNVTDSNGADCTFVADAVLGRYDLVQK